MFLKWIGEFWCKTTHSRPMWPMHGRYTCPECLREYPVPWEGPVMNYERSTAVSPSSEVVSALQ
jgi:hypothetical protein